MCVVLSLSLFRLRPLSSLLFSPTPAPLPFLAWTLHRLAVKVRHVFFYQFSHLAVKVRRFLSPIFHSLLLAIKDRRPPIISP